MSTKPPVSTPTRTPPLGPSLRACYGLLDQAVADWSRLELDPGAEINGGDAVEWLVDFWKKARALVGPPASFEDARMCGYSVGKSGDPSSLLLAQVKVWLDTHADHGKPGMLTKLIDQTNLTARIIEILEEETS